MWGAETGLAFVWCARGMREHEDLTLPPQGIRHCEPRNTIDGDMDTGTGDTWDVWVWGHGRTRTFCDAIKTMRKINNVTV